MPRSENSLGRILNLPRRCATPSFIPSSRFSRNSAAALLPIQAHALAEIESERGLLAAIGVGTGKTLISFLAPAVLQSRNPLLLIPAKLREKTYRDHDRYSESWHLPKITIQSYDWLSRHEEYLTRLKPDLIVADECHRLKDRRAACTRRVARYIASCPDTRFVGLSGTVTSRSLQDFAHLLAWAFREQSPLPLRQAEILHWCNAVDEIKGLDDAVDYYRGPLDLYGQTRTARRRGVYRRLYKTPGVIYTPGELNLGASLVLRAWGELPELCRVAIHRAQRTWETPQGDELVNAVDMWRLLRQLAQGFWYRWEPPPPAWWLEPRRAWRKFVRETLSHSRHLDTELAVARAFPHHSLLKAWHEVRNLYSYILVAQWISNDVLAQAALWAHDSEGIVWVEHRAVGERLQRIFSIPYFGQGSAARLESHHGPAAASIAACGEGANLQHYSRSLVLSPPPNGKIWEQLLGRTHRTGQTADEVTYEILLTTRLAHEAMAQARRDAEYQKELTGQQQRLLLSLTRE